jgi:hypothetical protein
MEFGTEFGAKSALVKVVREGPLYVLTMHENENRFTGPFMKSLVAALSAIHASHEKEGNPPAALVTVSSQDRIWSNGLDLAEAGSRGADYIAEFMRTLEKFLTFPMPTVAAINGHAFVGDGKNRFSIFILLTKFPNSITKTRLFACLASFGSLVPGRRLLALSLPRLPHLPPRPRLALHERNRHARPHVAGLALGPRSKAPDDPGLQGRDAVWE